METAAARNVSGTIEASELMITLAENESEIPTSERELIIHFMVMYKGRKKEVAEALKMTRPTLDKRLKKYNIDAKSFKNRKKHQ